MLDIHNHRIYLVVYTTLLWKSLITMIEKCICRTQNSIVNLNNFCYYNLIVMFNKSEHIKGSSIHVFYKPEMWTTQSS